MSTDTATLRALLNAQRSAFLREGPPALARRREDLDKLGTAIRACREQLVDAINVDFGHRPHQETSYMDLVPVVDLIRYLQRNLERWTRAEPRGVGLHFRPASNRVLYQPLGVVGIISPWNFPVALLCPSCGGRRMAERAAHLLDQVFPDVTPGLASRPWTWRRCWRSWSR